MVQFSNYLKQHTLPPGLYAAETATISALSGKVELKPAKAEEWSPAAEGSLIEEGGTVRTGADGRVLLVFSNKSKVWLKEASAIEISSLQERNTAISLKLGNIKVRVPHLRFSENLHVRTQAAVAAVRGTELTLGYDELGETVMEVLYGLVKLSRENPPPGVDAVEYVPQGRLFAMDQQGQSSTELLTREREVKALEDWQPGFTREQRVQHLIAKAQDRSSLRNYAREAGRSEQMVQDLVTNVREADIEAGRTLTDVHGNLVRVDQRMLRPDSYSLQIINLVKRPVYSHNF
ncbi:MAG TPA: FecR family protein, partial [Elusimicrobiales bacterium]|nr:FecR family protein [Elusimicrobiales bacterium]